MTVRAKFKCVKKAPSHQSSDEGNVRLEAVIDGSEENKEYFSYTPFGVLDLGILNPPAFSQFEVGQEYYLDITKA